MAIEEMSELTKELCKYFRYGNNEKEIAEEIADVKIMLTQLEMIFDVDLKMSWVIEEKISRLRMRIAET